MHKFILHLKHGKGKVPDQKKIKGVIMEADSSTSADVPNRNENMMRGKQNHVSNAPNKPCMTPAVILFCN